MEAFVIVNRPGTFYITFSLHCLQFRILPEIHLSMQPPLKRQL